MITEVSTDEEFDKYVGGGIFSFNNHPKIKSNIFKWNIKSNYIAHLYIYLYIKFTII